MRAWARDHLTDGWVNKPLKFRLVCREFSEFPGELVFTRLSGRLGIVGKYNAYFHGMYSGGKTATSIMSRRWCLTDRMVQNMFGMKLEC